MSRVIDPEQPLSDEDREWMENNGREAQAREHDARLGVERDDNPAHLTGFEPSRATGVPAGRGLVNTPGLSPAQIQVAMGDKQALLASFTQEELEQELERKRNAQDESDDDSAGASEQSLAATQVKREGEYDVPSYDTWKMENLRAQLGVRELSKSGGKNELVRRLREDDQDDQA